MRIKSRLKYLKKRYEKGECHIDRISRTMSSYNGIFKHCDSYNLQKYILDDYILIKNEKA